MKRVIITFTFLKRQAGQRGVLLKGSKVTLKERMEDIHNLAEASRPEQPLQSYFKPHIAMYFDKQIACLFADSFSLK